MTRRIIAVLAFVVVAVGVAAGVYFVGQAGDGTTSGVQGTPVPTVTPSQSAPGILPSPPASPAPPASPTPTPAATPEAALELPATPAEDDAPLALTLSPTLSPVPSPPLATATPTPPMPRVWLPGTPLAGAEPYQLEIDEAGRYYIPDRGDGCTWTQQLALAPLKGGDSPIIVLYSDCKADFYLAYYVTDQYISNVRKAPVYQPRPLMPSDIQQHADGKYYVPDRGDGCVYEEVARPTIEGQQWVMLRSSLCHHFLWRFSPATGELFPMDPTWWPTPSAPSPSEVEVGPDGRYFVRDRGDGCAWVESRRSDTWVYFATDCNFLVPFAYDTATGEFHRLGVP